MFITIYLIPIFLLNTHWYHVVRNELTPTFPFLLTFINFPFDFATILVSILLLRIIIKHKRFIAFIAIIDIFISAILTITLYSFLLLVKEGWDILHFHTYFVESLQWFKEIIIGTYQSVKYHEPLVKNLESRPDIHLLPILLTTFIPVVLYMSVFIFISFCKFIMMLAARIFGAVGEKE